MGRDEEKRTEERRGGEARTPSPDGTTRRRPLLRLRFSLRKRAVVSCSLALSLRRNEGRRASDAAPGWPVVCLASYESFDLSLCEGNLHVAASFPLFAQRVPYVRPESQKGV